jgi:hypothetical protein
MIARSRPLALTLALAALGGACAKEEGLDLSIYADRLVDGKVVNEGKAFVADVQGRMIHIDDVGLRVLPASPPSRIVLRADIPRGGVLNVAAGIPDDKRAKGAVEFVISVIENGASHTVLTQVVDPISRPEHRMYVNLKADLARFAGKDRQLVLETRAFEKDGDLFRAYWGAPAIAVDPKFAVRKDPLVIVYLVDTLRADHTTPYGYKRRTTPELDKFAADAVVFESAIAHASWTKPSVASLMTSRLPSRHRAVQLRDPLDSGQVTLAEMLDGRGFATGAAIANSVVYDKDSNFQQGFDVFAGLHGIEGERSKVVDTRLVVDKALEFLDSRRGLPTFLYVHTMDPHVPYAPPAPFDTMFEPHPLPDHPGVDPRTDYKEPGDRERLIAQYDGDIAYGDLQFGRFVAELKKRGIYDDALIFFVGDHGEEFLDHGREVRGQPGGELEGGADGGAVRRPAHRARGLRHARARSARDHRAPVAGCGLLESARADRGVGDLPPRLRLFGHPDRAGEVHPPLLPAGGRALLRSHLGSEGGIEPHGRQSAGSETPARRGGSDHAGHPLPLRDPGPFAHVPDPEDRNHGLDRRGGDRGPRPCREGRTQE